MATGWCYEFIKAMREAEARITLHLGPPITQNVFAVCPCTICMLPLFYRSMKHRFVFDQKHCVWRIRGIPGHAHQPAP